MVRNIMHGSVGGPQRWNLGSRRNPKAHVQSCTNHGYCPDTAMATLLKKQDVDVAPLEGIAPIPQWLPFQNTRC